MTNRPIESVVIEIQASDFRNRIAVPPPPEIRVVGAVSRQVEIALGMPVEAGEVEVCGSGAEDGG